MRVCGRDDLHGRCDDRLGRRSRAERRHAGGRIVSAVVDGKASVTYKIEGTEKMGNGTAGTSGPGSVILRAMPLPAHTLTISNVFPDQSVVFAFDRMTPDQRRMLSACFAS